MIYKKKNQNALRKPATSKTWTRTLDSDPGPWTWTRTLNLDPGPGPGLWTLDPDPEKPGPWTLDPRPGP